MSREQYVLRYENKYLVELGRAIDYLMSCAVSFAVQHTLLETAFAGIFLISKIGCYRILYSLLEFCKLHCMIFNFLL